MKFFPVILALFSTASLYSSYYHKIIYLVSTPRSLSTVFVRMMQARGDMSVFNEPAQKACKLDFDVVTNGYRPEAPLTHQEVVDQLLLKSTIRPVFAKDQSFIVKDLLENDPRLINTGKNPAIVFTQDLYNNPEATIRKFCNDVNIPYIEHALSWHSLGEDFDGTQEWHETKSFEMMHHWHKDAILSTQFKQPTQYEVDAQGNPTFSEIADPHDRQGCIEAYQENLKYYQEILKLYEN